MGWIWFAFRGALHLVPEDEAEGHDPENCCCRPTPHADDDRKIIHHSFDGREAFEEGARKVS